MGKETNDRLQKSTLRQMWYLNSHSIHYACTKTFNIVTILDVKGLLQGLGEIGTCRFWRNLKEPKMSWTWKNKGILIQLFSKNITRTNLSRITVPNVLPADPGVTWRTHGRLLSRREIFLTLIFHDFLGNENREKKDKKMII